MTMTFVLRYMRLEDIPQIVSIDRASFPTPWSASTYKFEITNRETSHMVVLEACEPNTPSGNGVLGLIRRLRGTPSADQVVGYGGCWLIAGEAHISTIAVSPEYRGRGLGELLLAGMLQCAMNLEGEYSILEVREGNATAQALYRKYEYRVVGRRRGYYRDNNEDALLMEARPLDVAYGQRLADRLAALSERVQFTDRFTQGLKT